ncbi:MAG: D-alanyl-D-alanine carboxypeptidase [Bacteriovoracaceae bacterium]
MNKMLSTLSLGLMLTTASWANTSLTQDFRSLLTKYKVGNLANQAYCYKDTQGSIGGYQISKLMPIASVTKLFTTYFATELLDLNKRYTTKIYIKGDALHIEGGNDPYFEEEKMLLMIRALNDQGYSSFKTVTFDKNFKFSDLALGQYQVLSTTHILGKIATYMNTDKNNSYVQNKLKSVLKFATEEGINVELSSSLKMKATAVRFSDVNPIRESAEILLTHKSLPLHRLLKSMNVMSKNLVSHYVFDEAAKIQSFNSFMKSRGFDTTKMAFYNGSGLPVKTGKIRKDNLTTCTIVLDLIQKLHQSIVTKGFLPQDIIAVNGGQDNGSFRERFLNFPETHGAVVSKTGTLVVASALSGTLSTLGGEIQFSILNKPNSSLVARKFQDNFVARMFHHLGEAAPVPYEKISIFPWDDSPFFEN